MSRRREARAWRHPTIHNERNGIIVSSDDSSDDDDVFSRGSSGSIHCEANGIWVSSDEDDLVEDHTCYGRSRRDVLDVPGYQPQSQYYYSKPASPHSRWSGSSTTCSTEVGLSDSLSSLPPTSPYVRKGKGSTNAHFKVQQQVNINNSTEGISLTAKDFWDPVGTKAKSVEKAVFATGIVSSTSFWAVQWYIGGAFLLLLTVLLSSWMVSKYRILQWRRKSGIQSTAIFSDMYYAIEGVCIDTCVQSAQGEMCPRHVCSGELAAVLRTTCAGTEPTNILKFWCEACVHFRLTLRSGCEHIGGGRLKPRNLTTASLIRLTPLVLPLGMCNSCRNKTEIEAKFPLKFS